MELIVSGFGGQGVLTAGLLCAYVGNEMGKQVLWSPSYGSEMRGGTANCNVIISEEETGSPLLAKCDALLAMNEPSVVKFEQSIRPGGLLLLNSSIIPEGCGSRGDIERYKVAATGIANEAQNPRGANLVMLGGMIRVSGLFEKDYFMEMVTRYFAEKGIHNPLNVSCIRLGYETVEKV